MNQYSLIQLCQAHLPWVQAPCLGLHLCTLGPVALSWQYKADVARPDAWYLDIENARSLGDAVGPINPMNLKTTYEGLHLRIEWWKLEVRVVS